MPLEGLWTKLQAYKWMSRKDMNHQAKNNFLHFPADISAFRSESSELFWMSSIMLTNVRLICSNKSALMWTWSCMQMSIVQNNSRWELTSHAEAELPMERHWHLNSWTGGGTAEYAPCVLRLPTSEGDKLRTKKSLVIFEKTNTKRGYASHIKWLFIFCKNIIAKYKTEQKECSWNWQ